MSEIDTTFLIPSTQGGFKTASPDSANRAAFFGDGVFETMVFKNGQLRFREAHWARLQEGLKQLKIKPDHLTPIHQLERSLYDQYGNANCLRVRWNVYRSGIGKYTPISYHSEELLVIQPFTPAPGVKNSAYISEQITVPKSPWSHCKTLNALIYVMANIERAEKGADEVILTDQQGFISEGGIANLFWIKDGVYYTPSLECNCIAGVGRNVIIDRLHQTKTEIVKGEFRSADLLAADQVFTSNASGISYIKNIGTKTFNTSPIGFIEKLFY